jgi:hypothetical protein
MLFQGTDFFIKPQCTGMVWNASALYSVGQRDEATFNMAL